jgi:cell division protease FtsH
VEKKPNRRNWIIYSILLVVLIALIGSQLLNSFRPPEAEVLETGVFVAEVEKGTVTEVTYNASTGSITGKYLKDGEKDVEKATAFTSTYAGDGLNELMLKHTKTTKFNIEVQNPNAWVTILSTLLPLLLIGGLAFFIFSQFNSANNKQMQFGKTKAKKAHEERPNTKFSDVAGIDEAVEELQEIKDFLVDPARYQKLGAKIPRGVLLVGPPGTGKTLLARAVAGEAGVPFFSISGSDFVEMFVGVGASRVRDLFEQAKTAAPSIIFIDEIDAVGRQRGAGLGGGHDEREQTLNQLLVEMDGFADHQSVILIAATNRVDILDPALLRPGRFDRQIMVMRPDLKGREEILKVHSEGKPLAHSVELERLAKMTPGFTGADLANLMNEAALLTARKNKKLITMVELEEAMEREIAGPERKSRVMTEKEKRTIAYHEAGHALVGHVLEHSDPVHKISIISRGQALGYTLSLPAEDRFLSSRNEMYDDLAVFLGGRVAEEIFCDDITTGASNDLERATKMARQMVTRYGMTEALGHQVYGEANHEVFLGRDYSATPDYSEATAQRIDEEVAEIMTRAHDVAQQTLLARTQQIDLMVQILLDRETVEGEALDALLNNTWEDYIANEGDLLAKKAADLRKQEEDDERRAAAEEVKRSIQNTPLVTADGKAAPPPNSSMLLDEKTIADIYAGKVTLGELVSQRLKGSKDGGRAEGKGNEQGSATKKDALPPDPTTLLDTVSEKKPSAKRRSSRTVKLEIPEDTASTEDTTNAVGENALIEDAKDTAKTAEAAPEADQDTPKAAKPASKSKKTAGAKKDEAEKPAPKHARTTTRKPAKKQEDDSKKDA